MDAVYSLGLIDYVIIGVVILAIVFIGVRGTKKVSVEEFLVGGRSVPAWLLGFTIAAGVLGGGVLLVFSEYAYKYGLAALCITGGLALGALLLIPIALRYKKLADSQGFYSLPDLFRYEWGKTTGSLSAVVVFIWTVGFILMQLIAAGLLVSAMIGVDYWYGVIGAAVVVASYLIVGGFKSVIITDFLQYIALLVILLVIMPSALGSIDWTTTLAHAATIDPAEAIAFFVLGALNIVVSADLWQRIYAAKSVRDAKRGVFLAAILIMLGGLLLMIPAFAAGFDVGVGNAQSALVGALALYTPRAILGLGLVAVLMAVVSTLDTMVFVLGLSVSHDITVQTFGKSIKSRVTVARISMITALVIGSLVALFYSNLLNVGIAISAFGLILAPALIISRTKWRFLKWRGEWRFNRGATQGGLLLGLICAVALIVGELTIHNVLTPESALSVLGASILGSIVGGMIYKHRAQHGKGV